MKTIGITLAVFVMGIFSSEKLQNEIIVSSDYKIILVDTVSLPVSENIKMFTNSMRFYEDNEDSYLLISNLNKGELYCYSFKLRERVVKRSFPILGKVKAIEVISMDSIYVLDNDGERLSRYDISGKNYQSWNVSEFDIFADQTAPLTIWKGKILARKRPKPDFLNRNTLLSHFKDTLDYVIELETHGQIASTIVGHYPDSYQDEFYYDLMSYRTIGENDKIVRSFAADNRLYVEENGHVTPYDDKSDFHKDPTPFDLARLADKDYVSSYLSTECRYGRVLYDKYRNLYYRVVEHAADSSTKVFIDSKWSIMVFDNQFRLLDETIFPAKEYDFLEMFVSRNGLHIAKRFRDTKVPKGSLRSCGCTSVITPTFKKNGGIEFETFLPAKESFQTITDLWIKPD